MRVVLLSHDVQISAFDGPKTDGPYIFPAKID